MSLNESIEIFFRHPNDFNNKEGLKSTLYLLRRDISLCMGYDPNNNQKIEYEALWPGIMGLWPALIY
jgi:hypothetical protein